MKFKEIFSDFLENFIVFFLFLIAFSTLFFLPNNPFPLQTKQYFLIGFAFLFLFFWTAWVLINKKFHFIGKKLDYIFPFLFLICALISSLFSQYKHASFWGNESWSLSFLSIASVIIIFFVCLNYLSKEKFSKFFYIFLSTISVSQLLYILFAFKLIEIRWMPMNLIGQNSSMAYLSALSLIACTGFFMAYLQRKRVWLQKGFLILFSLIGFFILLIADMAAAWSLAIIGSLILAGVGYYRLRGLPIKYLIFPVVILILAVIFLVVGGIDAIPKAQPEALPSAKTSYYIAKQVLWQQPLQGVGLNNYSVAYNLYRPLELNQTEFWSDTFYFSQSKFFDLWTTGGLVVILSYLALLVYFSIRSIKVLIDRKQDLFVLPLATVWLLYLIGTFLFMSNLLIDLFVWFILAGITIYAWKPKRRQKISRTGSVSVTIIASILLISSVIVLYMSVKRFVAAQAFFQMRKNAFNIELQPQVEEWLKFAVRWDKNNDIYHRQLAQFHIATINNLKAIQPSPEFETQYKNDLQVTIQKANQAALDTIEINSSNFLNHLLMADFYNANRGLAADASKWREKSLTDALELFPTNVFIINQIAQSQLEQAKELMFIKPDLEAQGKDTEALDVQITEFLYKSQKNAKQALEYKIDYLPAQFTLGLAEAELGNNDQAIIILEDLSQKVPQDIGVKFYLALIYTDEQQTERAIDLLNQAVKLAPTFSNGYWVLAQIYSQLGEIEKARETLEKILEYDPQNQNVITALEALKNRITVEPPSILPEIPGPEQEESAENQ